MLNIIVFFFYIILFCISISYIINIYNNNKNKYYKELFHLFYELSHSQHKEDYIFFKYLINKQEDIRNNTFIEIGALDGLLISNTYVFEKYFGWNGLLIEASPSNYKKLLKSRRNSKKINTAICNKKEIKFVEGYREISGDASEVMKKLLKKMDKEKIITIPCKRMTNLLIENKFIDIFFFSLDVEGSELNVINTIDFNIIKSMSNIFSKIFLN